MTDRILFRAPNWLGDAVMATVVPAALRRAHPAGRVGVLAPRGLGDVFRGHPAVDAVLEFDPGGEVDAYRSAGYDRVLLAPQSFGSAWRALRGGVRERLGFGGQARDPLLKRRRPGAAWRRDRHQVENYRELAALAGASPGDEEPDVRVAAAWRTAAESRWGPRAGDGRAPRVAIQPGATYGPSKRWAADRFGAVARSLAESGATVALLGGPGDREAVAATRAAAGDAVRDLSERTTVGELAGVLAAADLLVSNDTGPMHLAAAVGTRVVAIFGSTEPVWTGPRGPGHRVLRHRVPCAPCFRRTCSIGYLCLEGIPVPEVLGAAMERIAAAGTSRPPAGGTT